MKITIEVHSARDLLRDTVAGYCKQGNPSALLKVIWEGVMLYATEAGRGPAALECARALTQDLTALQAKWKATEDAWPVEELSSQCREVLASLK